MKLKFKKNYRAGEYVKKSESCERYVTNEFI